jgi:hypothetical protein
MTVNRLGTTLAMANTNGVQLVPLYSGKPIDIPAASDDIPLGMAFSPDGAILAISYKSGEIRFWDVAQRALVQSVACGDGCGSVEFSPTGTQLAAFPSPGDPADVFQLYNVTVSTTRRPAPIIAGAGPAATP